MVSSGIKGNNNPNQNLYRDTQKHQSNPSNPSSTNIYNSTSSNTGGSISSRHTDADKGSTGLKSFSSMAAAGAKRAVSVYVHVSM